MRKSPTKFIFALKSQDKIAMFENPDDYIRYLCADHLDKMKDWVLSLRAAKVIFFYNRIYIFIRFIINIFTAFLHI